MDKTEFPQNEFVTHMFSKYSREATNILGEETQDRNIKIREYVIDSLKIITNVLKLKSTFSKDKGDRNALLEESKFASTVVEFYSALDESGLEHFAGLYSESSTTDLLGTLNSAKILGNKE
jgi:hypothetical protein